VDADDLWRRIAEYLWLCRLGHQRRARHRSASSWGGPGRRQAIGCLA